MLFLRETALMVPTLHVVRNCWNDSIQAAEIDVRCTVANDVPHITISAEPGVRPAESNSMLAIRHHRAHLYGVGGLNALPVVNFKRPVSGQKSVSPHYIHRVM